MPLPPAQPRTPHHTRQVTYRGYQRDDGLWDIEGQLRDIKERPFDIPGERTWQTGDVMHDMSIRVTIDDALRVHEIVTCMDATPHGECPQAQVHMHKMIGCTMGPGWRQAIELHLGEVRGCTHLRELLYNMATAAFQTLAGSFSSPDHKLPPLHLGKCMTWDFNGPAVQRRFPMFFGKTPPPKAPKRG